MKRYTNRAKVLFISLIILALLTGLQTPLLVYYAIDKCEYWKMMLLVLLFGRSCIILSHRLGLQLNQELEKIDVQCLWNNTRQQTLLSLREPRFHEDLTQIQYHMEQLRELTARQLLQGISAIATTTGMLLVLSSLPVELFRMVLGIGLCELVGQFIRSRKAHVLSKLAAAKNRHFDYFLKQFFSPIMMREFRANGSIEGLQIQATAALGEVHKNQWNQYKSDLFWKSMTRVVQAGMILVTIMFSTNLYNSQSTLFLGLAGVGYILGLYKFITAGITLGQFPGLLYQLYQHSKSIHQHTHSQCPNSLPNIIPCTPLSTASCIALTGANGSGKSTWVLNHIDQLNNDHNTHELGVLYQGFGLLQSTIRQNLLLYQTNAPTKIRIWKALHRSGFDHVIRNNRWSLETEIGEEFGSGRGISMGEWQKLALARAFLNGKKTMILDEPESHLDQAALNHLQLSIQECLTSGIRIILITHSPQLIKLANHVIHFP